MQRDDDQPRSRLARDPVAERFERAELRRLIGPVVAELARPKRVVVLLGWFDGIGR